MDNLQRQSLELLDQCISRTREILSCFETEQQYTAADLRKLFSRRSEEISRLYELTHSQQWQESKKDDNFKIIQQRFRLLQDLDQLLRSQLQTRYNETKNAYKKASDDADADNKYRNVGRHKSSLFIESSLKG